MPIVTARPHAAQVVPLQLEVWPLAPRDDVVDRIRLVATTASAERLLFQDPAPHPAPR